MKKIISVSATLLLIASMMLMLTGCGGDTATFVGDWTGKIDMTDIINESIAEEDAETAKYVKFNDFIMILDYKFNDDGTYSIKANEIECKKAFEQAREDFKKGLEAALAASLKDSGLEITVEQALQLSGTSLDAILDETFGDTQFKEIVDEFANEGNFKVEDGKLFCTDGLDKTFDETTYEKYEIISNDEIKLTEFVAGETVEDTDGMASKIYPMTITRK